MTTKMLSETQKVYIEATESFKRPKIQGEVIFFSGDHNLLKRDGVLGFQEGTPESFLEPPESCFEDVLGRSMFIWRSYWSRQSKELKRFVAESLLIVFWYFAVCSVGLASGRGWEREMINSGFYICETSPW